jgi:hypothetical protein
MTEQVAQTTTITIWQWNGNTPPPNAGQFRSDSRNWNTATMLAFAQIDKTGANSDYIFQAMQPGDTIHTEVTTASANYHDWTVAQAPVQQGDGSWNVIVTDGGGSSAQASGGQDCKLVFSGDATPPPPDPQMKPTTNDIIDIMRQVDEIHANIMVIQPGISKQDIYWAISAWYQASTYAANVIPPP